MIKVQATSDYPNIYHVTFEAPNATRGLAFTFGFSREELQGKKPEDLPAWIWMRKLQQGLASVLMVMEAEKLCEPP